MKKIPKRAMPLMFSLYMSVIVASVMSLVLTALNHGIDSDYLMRTLDAYVIALPVAFLSVLVVRPLVSKLVDATVEK
jgi:hypothetical protein